MIKRELGKVIKEQRVLMGLSQLHLAKKCKLSSPQYVSNIERSMCGASPSFIKHASRVLKLDRAELVDLACNDMIKIFKAKFK